MRRLRQAAWAAALAGLGLLSGCQSCDPCSGGRPGLMSRLGFRPRSQVVYEGPMMGTPVSSGVPLGSYGDVTYGGEGPISSGFPLTSGVPYGSYGGAGCCDGAGVGSPAPSPFSGLGSEITGGPILDAPLHSNGGAPLYSNNGGGLPYGSNGGAPILQPRNTAPPAPPGTLPPPMVIPGEPKLAPVPNGNLAQPTPATPSSRRR